MILADAAHNPAQLLSDDWTCHADEDPELARRTRNALAAEYEGVLLTMTHYGRFGRLENGTWSPESA